jgi:hypothetical protein
MSSNQSKILVKKVVVGTPIKTVTSGAFAITNLGGVDVTAAVKGLLLNGKTQPQQPEKVLILLLIRLLTR